MISILLLGSPQVGKTCLASQICNTSLPSSYTPTSEIQHHYKAMNTDSQKITLQVLDTPSREFINPTLKFYYEQTHVFIIMFSLIDDHSFKVIEEWMKVIKQNSQPIARTILVGTKSDMPGRQVSKKAIKGCRDKYEIPYYELNCVKKNAHQDMLKEITENMKVDSDSKGVFWSSAAKQAYEEKPKLRYYLGDKSDLSSRDNSVDSNSNSGILGKINSKVKKFVNSVKGEDYPGSFEWRQELRRVEERLEDELRVMREEMLRINNRGNKSPRRFNAELENKISAICAEKKETDDKIAKLYESFEKFKENIKEELLGSNKDAKLVLKTIVQENEALKNRITSLEENNSTSDSLVKKASQDKEDEIFEAIRKFDSVSQTLEEDLAALQKKTEHNEDRVNGLFLFVEKELKKTENHLVSEIHLRLKELSESNSVPAEQISENTPEYEKIVKDLNESIRRCLAETDDFYNNLKDEVDNKVYADQTFGPIRANLQANSELLEKFVGSLQNIKENMKVCNKFVSLGNEVVERNEDSELYDSQEDKENVDMNIANLPPTKKPRMQKRFESEGAINFRPKQNKLNTLNKSFQNIQSSFASMRNNLRSYNEIPMEISSPTKGIKEESVPSGEIEKIWKAVEKLAQNTDKELRKIRTEAFHLNKLDVLKTQGVGSEIPIEAIKEILKDIQVDLHEEISVVQRNYETTFRGLEDMVKNYSNESLEKLSQTKKQLESLVQSRYIELKDKMNGSSKPFGGFKPPRLEYVPSDIPAEDTVSPTEDITFFDVKMFDDNKNMQEAK